MSYDLAIGDRAYSSWSLRGWLLFDAFGLPVKTHSARLDTDEMAQVLQGFFPARTVPAMRTPEGTVVCESLAIAEELASRHPEAELWPKSPAARAVAPIRARPSPIFWKRAGASGGRIYGFCNAFCRDKTVADPEAWQKFMAIHQS